MNKRVLANKMRTALIFPERVSTKELKDILSNAVPVYGEQDEQVFMLLSLLDHRLKQEFGTGLENKVTIESYSADLLLNEE